MSQNEFEQLDMRKNNFFRNQYRRLVKVLIILLIVCAGLLTTLFVVMATEPAEKYYASTTTGEVVPIESLSSPVVTPDFILQWSKTVARSLYSLSFSDYDNQLKEASGYFTPEAWQQFQNAMKSSGLLNVVREKKLILSAVVNGAPVIVDRYVKNGRFTWRVQLPLLVMYGSANDERKTQLYISLTITRVPELEIARGIAVTSFQVGGKFDGI